MSKYTSLAAIAAVLLLVGCDDDNEDAPTPAPTATPTPSPSPSPSPSPTPTPAAYAETPDFTADRSWSGYDRQVATLNAQGERTAFTFTTSDSATTSFTARTQSVTIGGFEDLPGAGTYAAGGAFTPTLEQREFELNDADLRVAIELPGTSFRYLATAFYRSDTYDWRTLIGAPTTVAELAGLGTLSYLALIDEDDADPTTANGARILTVDIAARTVRGTISNSEENFVLTGTIDVATNRITGTYRNEANTASGTFQGRLFGPGGAEIGLFMSITDAGGEVFPSSLFGLRTTVSQQ